MSKSDFLYPTRVLAFSSFVKELSIQVSKWWLLIKLLGFINLLRFSPPTCKLFKYSVGQLNIQLMNPDKKGTILPSASPNKLNWNKSKSLDSGT